MKNIKCKMRINVYHISLLLLVFFASPVRSQEVRTEFGIDFRVNSTFIDTTFSENATRVRSIVSFLRETAAVDIVEVTFCGSASPEGSDALNRRLARGRLASLEKMIRSRVEIPDTLITRNDSYIPWSVLRDEVAASDISFKEEILAVLDTAPNLHASDTTLNGYRITRLKNIDGGKAWKELNRRYFSRMRNASAVLITYKRDPLPVVSMETYTLDTVEETPEPVTSLDTIPVSYTESWRRHLCLKSNGIGWALCISNIALEADIAPHWSIELPVYYSAWNYFTSTIKFRTLAIQPEVRYWFKDDNDGIFAGAHIGFASYNLTLGGDYRYQDHNRHCPSFGGGISVGYRKPISRNNRWRAEFSIGAGLYPLHYDKFRNTDKTSGGLLIESKEKTYFGIDRATVSIVYTFDLKKRGGNTR